MAKIKLTKGELKRQRDSLKQYRHYLPTLLLKKQQLQMKILEARRLLAGRTGVLNVKLEEIEPWAGLLGDSSVDIRVWVKPQNIPIKTVNIAGANVPVFDDIHFPQAEYDLYATPLWIDRGIEELRLMVTLLAELMVIREGIAVLEQELRITTQRVNLFEKVKIPECQENIRRICIYLGDQQANAVGVSKVAKKKIEVRDLELTVV
jgi:V/A-type H+/Na+-transporting ATPase subunit D